jgi:hypothetical protein
MKVKTQVILEMAIEEGVQRGWRLAHKHVENPEEHVIVERINDAVMSAITDYFTFNEEEYL